MKPPTGQNHSVNTDVKFCLAGGFCILAEHPNIHPLARVYVAKKARFRVLFSMAEKQRFELWRPVKAYTISNRAPSTN